MCGARGLARPALVGLPPRARANRAWSGECNVGSEPGAYPCYGYRRIRISLGRDGHRKSVGRAYRLWRAAGLWHGHACKCSLARYVCLRRAGAGCSELRARKLIGRRACTTLAELLPDSQFR